MPFGIIEQCVWEGFKFSPENATSTAIEDRPFKCIVCLNFPSDGRVIQLDYLPFTRLSQIIDLRNPHLQIQFKGSRGYFQKR